MIRFVRLILLTTLFASCAMCISAQNAIDKSQQLNLDSLSADDEALLAQYKDSFDQEFLDVLAFFDKSKPGKTDTTVYNMDRSSHVEIGLGFASRIMIYGRDEGLSGVGFYPNITYFHKTGFYAGLSLGFYTDSAIAHSTRVPFVSLSAGYMHTFFKRWLLGVSYSRNFITYGSVGSRELLNNDVAFTTGVDVWNKIFVSASLYFDWSSLRNRNLEPFEKRAVEVPLVLRKEFIFYKILGAKVFTLTPALTAYFATDNTAFILTRAVAEQEKASLAEFTSNVDHFFGFTDVEPSVSIDWRIRNLDICAVPALAIPFNLFEYPTYDKVNNQLIQETSGGRVFNPKQYKFYALASVKYLFCVKKKPKKVKPQS